ncbi:hypothetical protein GCM10023147_37350 [Tsukamurella soli]|uniref:Tail assembly chaperone n=1 Tax=Tsukamurella soli TaxID=644556 RepID=A0ABP8K2X1_9ACTN
MTAHRFSALRAEVPPREFELDLDEERKLTVPIPTGQQLLDYAAAATRQEQYKALLGGDFQEVWDFFMSRDHRLWPLFWKAFEEFVFGNGAGEVEGGSQGS